MKQLIDDIQQWAGIYNFSFQFWGEDNNNVFIEKDGVELASFGGEKDIEAIIKRTLAWIKDKNPQGYIELGKPKPYVRKHLCQGCGCSVAAGNDYCGECLCEDDSDY